MTSAAAGTPATSQRSTRDVQQAIRWPETLCDEEVELHASDFLPEPARVVAMTIRIRMPSSPSGGCFSD